MKKFIRFSSKILHIFILTILSLSMVAAEAPASPVRAGTVAKTILETGTQNPGDQVTVQLKLTKPNIDLVPSAELVIVVDTSLSLADEITAMKSKLKSFVTDTLSQYPGAVRVGITKIGNGTASFDSDNNVGHVNGQNAAMYPTGSTLSAYTNVRRPNVDVGIDKVVTINSSNINSLLTAIDNIKVEPGTNPTSLNGYAEQRDGANSYTSDIGPGMQSGVNMFTSDSNTKFMLLLTDGLANKGFCPVTSSATKAVSGWKSGTQFQVLSSSATDNRAGDPNGSYNSYVATENGHAEDSVFPANYPNPFGEPGVCYPYVHIKFSATGLMADNVSPHYVSSYGGVTLPKNSILDQIASIYGGVKSSDIQRDTLDKVADIARIASISVQDQLNTSVFASIDSWVGLFDCDTGKQYLGNTWAPSGAGMTLILSDSATAALSSGAMTNVCVKFKATINSNPATGSQPINSSSSSNKATYTNPNGTILTTDTISVGSITIANNVSIPAPTNMSVCVDGSNVATYSWTGDPSVTSYKIHNKNLSKGTEGFYTTPTSPYSQALQSGTQSYEWSLIPQMMVNGTLRDGVETTPIQYSTGTNTCKSFDLSVPGSVSANPGNTNPTIATTGIVYNVPASWAPANTVTVKLRSFTSGDFDCSTIPTDGAVSSGSLNGITIKLGNGSQSQTVNFSTSQVNFNILASATATQGQYTACIGGVSNAAPGPASPKKLTINIEPASWLQVAGPTTDSSYKGAAGDVYSNGPIGTFVLPTTPIQQYFFMSPIPGVIAANNAINIVSQSAIDKSTPNPWIAAIYPQANTPLKTRTYARMLTDAKSNNTLTELSGQTSLLTNNACNNGSSGTFHVAGDAIISGSQPIAIPAVGCDGVNLIYFIDGNLHVSQNVVDNTNSGTFTFIVSGDVAVDQSVTQMDGVYVFGGRFSDSTNGGTDNPLAVHGSLLGLAGDSPSTANGSFTMTNGKSGLQRNLGATNNKSTAAEQIYFEPKYLYLLRNSVLGSSSFSWTE